MQHVTDRRIAVACRTIVEMECETLWPELSALAVCELKFSPWNRVVQEIVDPGEIHPCRVEIDTAADGVEEPCVPSSFIFVHKRAWAVTHHLQRVALP